jgi:hypothetical protein
MSAYIPFFQLSESTIICYDQFQLQRGKNALSPISAQNLTRGVFKGSMSENTRKDLRKKLSVYYDCMYQAGQKYRAKKQIFHPILTLTLPATQAHSDNEIKRECLGRFIESLKYNFDVRFFYWVAEKQLNSNLHFHILIDRFIDHTWVREKWNSQLAKLDYIQRFESKHGHANPNSTDIQAIRNLSKSSDYVTKYTSKADQQGGIQGRLHGESDILKNCKKYSSEIWSEMNQKLDYLVEKGLLELKQLDHCWVYKGDIRKMMKKEMPKTLQRWNDHYASIRTAFYPD